MKFTQTLILPLTVLTSLLTEAKDAHFDNLYNGRGMEVMTVPHPDYALTGTAPQGADKTYRILNGIKVLWEGKGGETFRVYPGGCKKLYFISENDGNRNWQNLQWEHELSNRAKYPGTYQLNKGQQEIPADGADAGPVLREMLQNVPNGSFEQSILELPKGEYHFYPQSAPKLSYYISNHDQQDMHPVGLPIVGCKNLKINGNGSTFVFHGAMQPILIMDSKGIEINDITIKHDAPYYNEGKIVEIKDGTTTLEFSALFRWQVINGKYYMTGDGTPRAHQAVLAFEADGSMVATGKAGDMLWPNKCEQVAPNRVKFFNDAAKMGLKEEQILVLRHYGRPHPAMVIYRTDGTLLNNVVFQDSQGMALIAQRSKDITINGGGCICAPGRVHTASADATHFSNCAGTITVNGALYEGMMDDAINVHSTCLDIVKVASPSEIIVRYMHSQSVGFEVFEPGERLQFIKGKTLENHPTLCKIAKVSKINETHLHITLESPLPEGIGVGDAIENADWYPAVNFINCTVQHNRARGTLFTTPKPVLVEGCKFLGSSGSAILLAGDAQGWYESGRCLDIKIRNNVFDHNLIQRYQFTEGIISIYPMVKQPMQQTERYHKNILIEDNTFYTHRVPLIYAISADGIIFRNNAVQFDDKHAPMHNKQPYVLQHCGKTDLQKL